MTSRSPGTRVRMPRAEREAQMLAVAEQVFSSRGIQAATMDEIAELVGVTKPLIYDYFGSKEGLLAATIERARGQLLAALIDAWVAQPLAPARDRVAGVVHAFFAFIDEHEQAFTLLRTEGALIGEASASVERIRQQTAKAFAEGLRTLPAFTALESRRVTVMAEILIGACERLAVWRTTHPGTTADEATALVVTTIWDGLASVSDA
ncbi:MAG: TetR/AcrR family transcriptional regulator [Dermatophilaceae bacterium]|nr:TetR/AcrR family transcriptional regulator [Dermatophilaceae bacterium]